MSVLACGFATAVAAAATTDQVVVNLPYRVTVNDRVLEPGEYIIKQADSLGGSRWVVQIFKEKGMKHETTMMTIPTVDRKTPENTVVVLHNFGKDYYFDKIWIQGKDYGYEFVLPEKVKSRERERHASRTMPARHEEVQSEAQTASATSQAVPSKP